MMRFIYNSVQGDFLDHPVDL